MPCLGEDWQSLNVTFEVHGNKQASLLYKQAEPAMVVVAEEAISVISETLMGGSWSAGHGPECIREPFSHLLKSAVMQSLLICHGFCYTC